MGRIKIKRLLLRAIIGFQEWERKKKQDVLINIEIDYNSVSAEKTDQVQNAIDYKALTKRIISEVESSDYFLIESLTSHILDIIMEDTRITAATVFVEKPGALRFAESVGFEESRKVN